MRREKTGLTARVIYVVKGPRLYNAMVVGPGQPPPEAERFLASFHVTEPAPAP